MHQLLHTTRVRWDQPIPGNPVPPGKKERSLRVFLQGSPIHGMYPSIEIPTRFLHIDPAFLADAIRHYAEHPEEIAQRKLSTL